MLGSNVEKFKQAVWKAVIENALCIIYIRVRNILALTITYLVD